MRKETFIVFLKDVHIDETYLNLLIVSLLRYNKQGHKIIHLSETEKASVD